MMGQNVEHHQSIFDSAASRNLMTQDDLLTVVMHASIEEERAGLASCHLAQHPIHGYAATARLEDGPTSEATRDFLHVFLRVTTINSEGMQLHQLARVVFVDATSLLLLWSAQSLRCVWTDA